MTVAVLTVAGKCGALTRAADGVPKGKRKMESHTGKGVMK